jgi:hypothetical protein
MDEIERPVLQHQLSATAKIVEQCLQRLNVEWSEFVDIRIRKIHDTHLGKESVENKSDAFQKFIEKL